MLERSAIIRRVVIAATLAVAFLIMASVFNPGLSQADEASRAPSQHVERHSTDPHDGLTCLGVLQHGRFNIELFAGATAPLYSVYDRDGNLLATLRTAAQIEQQFPDLPIHSLDADTPAPPTQLLLVEPPDDGL